MKALYTIKIFIVGLAVLFTACAPNQIAQTSEYDDMYFTAQDRNFQASTQTVPYTPETNRSDRYYEETNRSAKTMNPEYIAGQENDIDNYTYDDSDVYYQEDYAGKEDSYSNVRINNYYGSSSPFRDPFYSPYGSFYNHYHPFY